MSTIQMRTLASVRKGELRAVMDGTVEVTSLHPQFCAVFAAGHAHRLFAKPVSAVDPDGQQVIRWLTENEGEVVPFASLGQDMQDCLLLEARAAIGDLYRRVRDNPDMQQHDRDMMLATLEKAFEVPDTSAIFAVGGRPVLTQWGFVRSAWNAPRRVLRMLFEDRLPPEVVLATLTCLVVEEASGVPLPGVRIACHPADGTPAVTAVTAADGVVRFQELGAGQTIALAAADELSGAPLAPPLTLELNEPAQVVTYRLPPRSRLVRLHVRDGAGAAMAGVALSVTAVAGEAVVGTFDGETDADGILVLPAIPVWVGEMRVAVRLPQGGGDHILVALDPDRTDHTLVVTSAEPKPRRRDWRLAAALLAGLVLVVAGTALWLSCLLPFGPQRCQVPLSVTLHLQVIDGDNRAGIANANVTVTAAGMPPRSAITDARGTVSMGGVEPGQALTIAATADGYELAVRDETCCAAGTAELALRRLPSVSQIVKVLHARTNEALSGAAVTFQLPQGAETRITGMNGVVSIAVPATGQNFPLGVSRDQFQSASDTCCAANPQIVRLEPTAQRQRDEEREGRVFVHGGRLGAVNIILTWQSKADLDLHVWCPGDGHLYFASDHKNDCAGQFEVDTNRWEAQATTSPVENIYWDEGKLADGDYRIGAKKFQGRTDHGRSTELTLTVRVGGEVIKSLTRSLLEEKSGGTMLVMRVSHPNGPDQPQTITFIEQ